MTKISVSKCSSYHEEDVQRAVNKCLEDLGGLSSFIKDQAKKPEEAVTTHPAVMEAIITAVKKTGAVPLVGDSPGGLWLSLGKHWKNTGIG